MPVDFGERVRSSRFNVDTIKSQRRIVGDQDVGELNKVLADMAVDDKLGERFLTERSLVESLTRATKRWAVLSICRSLLEAGLQCS